MTLAKEMRNICIHKKKFYDHPFLCKLVQRAPDGPSTGWIWANQYQFTPRDGPRIFVISINISICTPNRPKLSYMDVLHHFENPKVKSFSLYLIKKIVLKKVTGCLIFLGWNFVEFFYWSPYIIWSLNIFFFFLIIL